MKLCFTHFLPPSAPLNIVDSHIWSADMKEGSYSWVRARHQYVAIEQVLYEGK